MFLTNRLLFYVRRRRIPGKIDIGKYRWLAPVTQQLKARAVKQLMQEHDNLNLLQTPYLTEKEEYRHVADTGRIQEMFAQKADEKRQSRMLKHKYMEEHLNHINVSRKWE